MLVQFPGIRQDRGSSDAELGAAGLGEDFGDGVAWEVGGEGGVGGGLFGFRGVGVGGGGCVDPGGTGVSPVDVEV